MKEFIANKKGFYENIMASSRYNSFQKKMSDTKAPLTFNRCIIFKNFINRKQRKCLRYWFHNNLHGISTALRCDYFSKKTSKKKQKQKHLYGPDKNYYNFCISNSPVINLIVGSRNMIKVSKNTSL